MVSRLLTVLVFIGLSAFVYSQNGRAQITAAIPLSLLDSKSTPKETTPSLPDEVWRERLGTFRVGIVTGARAALTIKKLRPFSLALEQELELPVELVPFYTQARLIAAQRQGRVEYGIFSATGFATLNGLCKCADALVAPLDQTGELGFTGIVRSTRADVTSLDDLVGRTVLMGREGDIARHLAPSYGLSEAGYGEQMSRWGFQIEQSARAIKALFQAKDVAAVFDWQLGEGKGDAKQPVLWRSPLIRFGPHGVRRSLPGDLKDRLSRWLLALKELNPKAYDAVDAVHGGGFEPATNEDYIWLEKALRYHKALPSTHEAGALSALRR